jgi:hypothetical protein
LILITNSTLPGKLYEVLEAPKLLRMGTLKLGTKVLQISACPISAREFKETSLLRFRRKGLWKIPFNVGLLDVR